MGIHRPFYMFGSIESAPLLDIKRLPLGDKSIIVFRHRRRIHAVVSATRGSTQARRTRKPRSPWTCSKDLGRQYEKNSIRLNLSSIVMAETIYSIL
jgi:hypothetical protein